MKEITSKDNQKLKEWAKLKQKKYIQKTNKVLLEGIKIIDEALKRGIKFDAVCTNFVTDEEFDCPTFKLSQSCFKLLSDEQNSQGVIAVANFPKYDFELPKGNFLILDNIQDPGNLGTIIRTAVACGFGQIYTLNCVDFRSSKVVRATMGTIFDCKIIPILPKDITKFAKYKVFCADMEGKSVFDTNKPKSPFGILMGNEGHGISVDICKQNFDKISLPMKNKVESLNVSVACGILMYLLSK